MQVKNTKVNGKKYSLYPMTGSEALGYAYDVGAYILPSISGVLTQVLEHIPLKQGEDLSVSNLMDNPEVLKSIGKIQLEGNISSFFRNCPKEKFMELWETTKAYIKEGDAKEPNWEIDFQGDAFSQIKLFGAYISAYVTPFLSGSMNTVGTSPQKETIR